jgi:site-specific DNA-methyltransferase (adenine-specific)/modification methylase
MVELNKIYNEDCIIGMSKIPDKSIDMICCDLPYGVLNKGNKSAKWDSVIPFDQLWEQYERIIKDKGVIVLFGQGMFSANLMTSNPSLWRYNLIWEKDRPTGFLNAKRMPMRSHEDIMVFYKKLGTYNPQMEYAPDRKNHPIGNGEHTDKNQCYGNFDRVINPIISEYKFPRSVVKIKKEHLCNGEEHPTQKPVELIEWLVKTYTNENEVVLDNCMGSGTTAVACINTNRQFIGFEITEEYFNLANKRIEVLLHDKENQLW